MPYFLASLPFPPSCITASIAVGGQKEAEAPISRSPLSFPKVNAGTVSHRAERLTSPTLSVKVQIYLFKAAFQVTLIRGLPTVRTVIIIQSINQGKLCLLLIS